MSNDVKQSYLKIVKPSTPAEKATRTTMDTIIVTPKLVGSWKKPSFQRPLNVNSKVMEVVAKITATQVIPGVITLGVMGGHHYLIDGQHRVEAFLLSGIQEGFADVRYAHFETEAEMADEFTEVNSRLNALKPDDILRALEKSNASLAKLRRACPFVGYDQIRRNAERSPVVSMSALLRCWFGTVPETPALAGLKAKMVTESLNVDETETLIEFLQLAFKAWGRDLESHRLWLNLNLTVCMWLYRRLVITAYSTSTKKIPKELFMKCLMSLAANGEYSDWLVGRGVNERDRSPTYQRIKHMFAKRIEAETGTKPRLPAPVWGGG